MNFVCQAFAVICYGRQGLKNGGYFFAWSSMGMVTASTTTGHNSGSKFMMPVLRRSGCVTPRRWLVSSLWHASLGQQLFAALAAHSHLLKNRVVTALNVAVLSFKPILWAILMLTLCLAPLQLSIAAPQADDDDNIYSRALGDLGEGRTQSAIDGFRVIVERHPNHQGALLDLALAYCQGEFLQDASLLFERLLAIPDLPPAIQALIKFYRMRSCQPPATAWHAVLSTSFGRAINLNQAPVSGLLYSAPLGVTLELSEKSRPKNDNFWATEAVYSRQPGGSGWSGGIFLKNTSHAMQHTFDNTTVQGLLARRTQFGGVQVEWQGVLLRQQFGAQVHLNSVVFAGSTMWGQSEWVASVADFNYPTLPDYHSRQVELRARLQILNNSAFNLAADFGWSYDHALADRPGGNRVGPLAQATAHWTFAPNQSLVVTHRRIWKRDNLAYSAVFLGDVKRQNMQTFWQAAWRYRISKHWQWGVDAQLSRSVDTVALFTHGASAITTTLEWDWR
ncbi:MAG: hypothetical protein PHT20_01945 [Rhodoferax sp.]|nr:hypothetical protein [Rhodoferax sp.]